MARMNLAAEEFVAAVEDKGVGGPLPRGEYLATITDIEVGEFSPTSESGKAGHASLTVHLKIEEGDFAGRKIRQFNLNNSPTFASGSANFALAQFLTALGFEGEFDVPEGEEWGDYIGETVGVRLGFNEPNSKGNVFNNVARWVKPADVDPAKTPTKDTPVDVPEPKAGAGRAGGAAKGGRPAAGGRGGRLGF